MCAGSPVILQWNGPDDPIGLSNYEVQLEYYSSSFKLKVFFWNPLVDQQVSSQVIELDVTAAVQKANAANFRWRVRAQDTGGSWGDWAPLTNFTYNTCIY